MWTADRTSDTAHAHIGQQPRDIGHNIGHRDQACPGLRHRTRFAASRPLPQPPADIATATLAEPLDPPVARHAAQRAAEPLAGSVEFAGRW